MFQHRHNHHQYYQTQCFEQAACLGASNPDSRLIIADGRALQEFNESCALGYKGRLCHACSAGYGRETFDSCSVCPPSNANKALMAFGIIMVILVLLLFIVFTVKSADDKKSTSSMMFKTLAAYGQVVGIASLFPYKWYVCCCIEVFFFIYPVCLLLIPCCLSLCFLFQAGIGVVFV